MTAALLVALACASTDPRPVIEEMHRRYARAIVRDDQAAMDELARDRYRPDFVFTKSDGRQFGFWTSFEGSRYEAEARRAGRPDGPHLYQTTLKNWKRSGDRLTVEAHHRVEGSWLQGDKRHPVSYRNVIRETWVNGPSGWQAVRFDELWVRGQMHGKKFAFKRG